MKCWNRSPAVCHTRLHTHTQTRHTGTSWHVYWQPFKCYIHRSTWFASLACHTVLFGKAGSRFSPDATGYSSNDRKRKKVAEMPKGLFSMPRRHHFPLEWPQVWTNQVLHEWIYAKIHLKKNLSFLSGKDRIHYGLALQLSSCSPSSSAFICYCPPPALTSRFSANLFFTKPSRSCTVIKVPFSFV